PNPVGQYDVLRVAGVEAGTAATVVDAMGRQVWTGALAPNGNRLGLRTGTYTVCIETAQGVIRQRLLVR
ncbi:T9SS type A sorting domain-containing protein, partial [Flavobacteriales bacterium]|nr:T9SS type A sorting domain-containing protein [Flavobacteriales bacterium]